MAATNRQWVLRQRPQGLIQDGDLELVETPIPVPGADEILVRTVYLSLDPTNRTWMNDAQGYLPPVALGAVMRGLTLGVVEQSNSDRFQVGDIVTTAAGGWSDRAAIPAAAAINGRRRRSGLASLPSTNSRLISSPTSRKKIAISPSLIQR